jgi:hypothetical protein
LLSSSCGFFPPSFSSAIACSLNSFPIPLHHVLGNQNPSLEIFFHFPGRMD